MLCFASAQDRTDPRQIKGYFNANARPPPFWQVSDAIARIGTLLDELPDGSSLSAFLPKIDGAAPDRELRCRAAVASTLLAALELARQGTLTTEQDDLWSPIAIHRRDPTAADQDVAA